MQLSSVHASAAADTFGEANAVLSALDGAFNLAVAHVARLCARDGKLDSELLDREQAVSYELALVAADLEAVRATLSAARGASDLDTSLAMTFTTLAAAAVVDRLESVYASADIDPIVVHAVAGSPALRALRRGAGSAKGVASLGQAVARCDGDVAQIALDEEGTLARDAFRRFGADVVVPLAERIHREDLTVPEAVLRPLREMGVFGLSIPEEYGGSASTGQGATSLMIAVTEELSAASLAAAGSLITRPEILARAILAGGTTAQKQRWLPQLAAGEPLCAIAITEPDYGSDVAGLMLRATKIEGGWLLDGAKTWCTFAGKAGVLMVVGRSNADRAAGHRGLSLFLVEKPSYDGHSFEFIQPGGGRLTGRAIPTIGYRGMHSFDLAFDGLFVPDDGVIGESGGLGQGFYLTMAGMVGGRIQTAGRALGVMGAAMRTAIRYAKDRKVFGVPLVDMPLTQFKIGILAARYAGCRYFAYSVARQVDRGGARMEASLVKLLSCRTAEWLTREAMQIHGGMGYAEETAASRYFVDARVLSIFEGAEETLALKVIAKSLFEDALKS